MKQFADNPFGFRFLSPPHGAWIGTPLLVYAAMIFAILGLRSLYVVLAALTRYLVHLEKSVIALLVFVAFKLVLQSGEQAFDRDFLHISAEMSLAVISSFVFPEKDDEGDDTNPANDDDTQDKKPPRSMPAPAPAGAGFSMSQTSPEEIPCKPCPKAETPP